ncbi:hypothetical protein TEA_024579 [Camellia sinensis var. sinensis]|uniref:GDSL esterase/lipase n=1 Tax=Camellia sinensis var. sinensis TaxID=542762 RepID=A0A4S4E3V2_CAMSN|nr:hypothetical protein TEA_024579 [Camellia sinensis var. sinensis]
MLLFLFQKCSSSPSSSSLTLFSVFILLLDIGEAVIKLPENVTIPAVLMFGDSIVDTGNNNNLETIFKVNYPPYGKDFISGIPSGRFCNGKVPSDFFVLLHCNALNLVTYAKFAPASDRTNKLAYKFKTKPLEHEDLMQEVFTDEAEQGSKRKNGASLSGKSKKPSTGVSVLANSFNHLSEAVRSQKHLTIKHGTGASQKYGIEACMQRIMAIPDFLSTPLFHFACIALENADYREILMCMPDDGNVVGWLAALKASKGL